MQKKKKMESRLASRSLEERKIFTHRPKIGKISKLLGEISIKQHFQSKTQAQPSFGADPVPLPRRRGKSAHKTPRIHQKLYEQAVEKKEMKQMQQLILEKFGRTLTPNR
jgi:hypothetical protein